MKRYSREWWVDRVGFVLFGMLLWLGWGVLLFKMATTQ